MNKLLVCSFLLVVASSYASVVPAPSYVVSVQGDDDGAIICGGVLIDERTVLTTAQCLAFYNPERLVVSVNDGAQIIELASYTFNPRFDFVTMEDNIGLLRLAEPANANVIEVAEQQPKTGASGVAYSWGANHKLDSVDVELVSTTDCDSDEYGWSDQMYKTMICGVVKNNKSCVPRFGNPVVSNNKLVGLTSFGCGTNGKAAILTDVPSLRSWIDSALKKLEQ
ncbi:trypsin theta [Zeugodacus cucurbitae]|uniref:trypsin theta n=1 Tax=Zeugodacus cucurbitae TaxID=28588 RepID=UPI0023D96580|nr:trypsin theta [Zeugodacus cucurbitae]